MTQHVSTKTYTYGNSEWRDLLTNYNGVSLNYDTIGNPLNWINGEQFTWSGGRQLTGITKGNNVISYAYNDSGIRTSKTVNGTRTDYYLNGTAIIMQKTGDNVIWYTYDENGLVTGFRYNGAEYYYFRNAQNDIIGIVNSSGAVVANYTYDSWGNHIAITDGNGNSVANNPNHIANINPFRYRGYYFDTETGLYYLQSRYYDANVGRFLNADSYISTGQGVTSYNMFAYCLNNPVNYSDSNGDFSLFGVICLAIVCVAVVVTTVNHIVNAINHANINKDLKESYTREEAQEEINKILEPYEDVTMSYSDETEEVLITNSNKVNSRKTRQQVSEIISRTDDLTDRKSSNISAEWSSHNLGYKLTPEGSAFNIKCKDVNIDYKKDRRTSINIITKIFEVLGWE